ncbi:hypothetical protein [Taibaiella koreensis]|uniref:hypothetical protein n=1 Tax=Taibaiella koreensis TaxID=1268548 RepID=UPI000E599DA9|nr:hypothetical protein [Taibaiella koreensis]
MKNKLLLPAPFRMAGLVLLVPSMILFVAWTRGFEFRFLDLPEHDAPWRLYLDQKELPAGTAEPSVKELSHADILSDYNLTNEVAILGLLVSLLFIAFARVRYEDERSTLIRLQSLQLSHYSNYLFLAAIVLLTQGFHFLQALFLLPFIFLVTFILIFYSRWYLVPKFAAHEE